MEKAIKRILNKGWHIKSESREIDIEVKLPTTVFEALIKGKVIEDPFYGNNEHEVKWVYESDWEYEINFDVSKEFLGRDKNIIVFYGLDTIADIYLNDRKIDSTKNMFRVYDYDVTSILKKNNNSLKIHFASPTKYARNEIEKYGVKLSTFQGHPGVPYLRKAQYSFGWDWGPQIPDIGIWKPVELISYDNVLIKSIYCSSSLISGNSVDSIPSKKIQVEKAALKIEVEFDGNPKDGSMISIEMVDKSDHIVFSRDLMAEESVIKFDFEISDPKLWWTFDLGEPYLYEIRVELKRNNATLDSKKQAVGIREIELVREKDKWGETFYFRLNGVPIFAKGGNWIPVDQFIPRGKKLGLYELNLSYSREANMNFIRVWGGGIYEDDLFYDLCDQMGILVWQDFPFACGLYPTHEEFFQNVKEEAIQNIKRLRAHPSLALWCGNNEIESMWFGYAFLSKIFWKFWKKRRFKNAYFRMFEEMLPDLVEKFDPNRKNEYWPSSPSDGSGRNNLRLIDLIKEQFSNDATHGDSHFWKVWHLSAPFSAYRDHDSRFMSEFGFESFPSMKTIKSFSPEEAYDFYSPIMENHQKNSAGNKKIMKYMKRRFSIPQGFREQVILSQITQAEAMEYGVEHWRRKRKDFQCMGALYWQINDCWPVASWSSIDYYGRWKTLHYFAKRFYDPLFPSVIETEKGAEFWLTNDYRESISGTYSWQIITNKGKIIASNEKDINIQSCDSIMIQNYGSNNFGTYKNRLEELSIFYQFIPKNGKPRQGTRLFGKPKDFVLEDPGLEIVFGKVSGEEVEVKVKARKLTLFAFLKSEIVDFLSSDNFFSLKPLESRNLVIKPLKTTEEKYNFRGEEFVDKLKKSLYVESLYELVK